ncbi:TonB-dependent receptor [Undibacterium sp. CY22W]|uniref:TonB-dependent receptor n=1 Tax=Undibacterium curvum TaxID=2762294 RepID=A0ABR7A6M8_9BURK|nr:TonB-dependent receptor [Undibacterium curvum]
MLKKTLVARALTLAFGVGVVSFAYTPDVMAQSNATATIYGVVKAGSATSVVLRNLETGLTRTANVDATGRFQATALPAGKYSADLMNGTAKVRSVQLDALAGQGTEAVFAEVQSVEVSARRTRIDVSSSTNGATFTAKELAKLPVATNVDAIIQLAPNTTRADSRYAGGASFGGGGASENAYYVNGFPVTNPLTQLGASELPFGAIGQAQVLTGGFGAEFGRSIGGVVNITTKSGTNNWEAGVSTSITPNALRSKPLDIYYEKTGAAVNSGTDGILYIRREDNTSTEKTLGAYVGGPIIQDKLFMFVAAEQIKTDRGLVTRTTAADPAATGKWGWGDMADTTQRYLAKFDWNLTDDHRLELTLLGDESKSDQKLYGYDYKTRAIGSTLNSSEHYTNVPNVTPGGANVQIFKYTGNITNDLTVTAMYGQSKAKHANTFDGYDVYDLKNTVPQIQYASPSASPCNLGLACTNNQALDGTILAKGAEDTVKSFRFDVEYKLGQHTLRAGLDDNKLSSTNAGDITAGGTLWRYFKTSTPNTPISLPGKKVAVASGGGFGVNGYYVRQQIFNTATNAYSDQSAQYIEDRYQITKDLLITAGLRNEQFNNKNGDNQTFLEMKNQIAPRLAAAWDVNGDASMKVFGSLGRYHLQIPTHLAVRGASRSTYTRQAFTYTGVDKNGAPTGLTPLTDAFSSNNEYGQAKDVNVVSALNMKPTYQDEITLGFERAYSPSLNFGAKATYRILRATIDDLCDQRPFDAWATRNKVNTDNWGGFGCASFNPGEDNDFMVDFSGTGKNYTKVHLRADELGFEKAARTYTALDLFVEHPYRNGWYGKVAYTWSRSKGNTEGQTKSDNAQTDVAATSTWDTPELMQYANGLLPNDRTHSLKAYGFYDLTPEWTVGANFLAASGRPKNCFGNHPTIDPNYDYGSVYFYCNGKPAPRGTNGNLPWDIRLDMNLAYKPQQIKGLAFKVDVFNFLNKQTIQTIEETYNSGNDVNPTYGRVISYTAPRSVKLSVEYNHKF